VLFCASMRRIPQLDLLRVVAVVLVIWNHFPFFRLVGVGSWIGVDLFFVLSGFLISGLLFDDIKNTGNVRLGRFYLRRAFKIYPAFYFFLLAGILVDPAIRKLPYWSELLFVQNYFPHVWGHTWSLAVEEHFYLALPLLLMLLVRGKRLHWVPPIALAIGTACLAARVYYCSRGNWDVTPFYSHTRFDALFLGVTLGYYFHFHQQRFCRWTSNSLLYVGLLLILPPFVLVAHPAILYSVGLTSIACGFGCIVVWFINHERLRSPQIEKIGQHSYSIYLWHLPIVLILRNEFSGFFPFLGTLGLCFIVGIVMANIVEFPLLHVRDRLTAPRKPSLSSSPSLATELSMSAQSSQ
jgi:peptidoglycan/LPS O-acetylase OafA/YrhL